MVSKPLKSTFNIEFSSTPAWFRTIRQLLITACTQCGFNDKSASQVAMAVDEAMCNIHRHGYEGRHDGIIEMSVTTCISPNSKIKIILEDQGKQVDLVTIKSRDLEDVKPGGLGVHLIQAIMDEVEWSHGDKGGMKVIMEKQYDYENKSTSTKEVQTNV